LNTVDVIDAFDLISLQADASFDLIILDPDYQDWNKFIKRGLIELALGKLKDSGNLIMFTKKPYDYNLRVAINPYYRNEIIWRYKKTGNWVSNKLPTYSYQKIYWATKSKDNYFKPRTGMPYSPNTQQGDKGYIVFDGYRDKLKSWSKSEDGIWLTDFLHIERKREGSGKIPTKPVDLCKIILRCFCPSGGLVLDPFCGGGNIPFMARAEGMNYICGDIDESLVAFTRSKLNKKYPVTELHKYPVT
jgi:DNA modification methylase